MFILVDPDDLAIEWLSETDRETVEQFYGQSYNVIVEIEDDARAKIEAGTHKLNADYQVVPVSDEELAIINQIEINYRAKIFLRSTDWKVMRHIREKALGVQTSLTDEEYLALEQERADAANSIV